MRGCQVVHDKPAARGCSERIYMGSSPKRYDELLSCRQSRCCEARAASDGVVSSSPASARPLAAHPALRPNHLSLSHSPTPSSAYVGEHHSRPINSRKARKFRHNSCLSYSKTSYLTFFSSTRAFLRTRLLQDHDTGSPALCVLEHRVAAAVVQPCSCQPGRLVASCRSLGSLCMCPLLTLYCGAQPTIFTCLGTVHIFHTVNHMCKKLGMAHANSVVHFCNLIYGSSNSPNPLQELRTRSREDMAHHMVATWWETWFFLISNLGSTSRRNLNPTLLPYWQVRPENQSSG
jgi:hypothetical protein